MVIFFCFLACLVILSWILDTEGFMLFGVIYFSISLNIYELYFLEHY